jgi:hypothetical protein
MKNRKSSGVDLNEIDRAIHSAARALGFQQKRVTFKQAERKLFALMAAGPRFTPSQETENLEYFKAVAYPYARLAILIYTVDSIKAEIESCPKRITEIRNEARKLAAGAA